VALDAALLDEALPAETVKVTLHTRAVASVGKPCEVVCRDHAELAKVGECLDFRFPQAMLTVATAVDRSRPVISVAPLTRMLLPIAIWSSALTAISQGLFRSTCAVTLGSAILPEKRSEVRNVIGTGH